MVPAPILFLTCFSADHTIQPFDWNFYHLVLPVLADLQVIE